MDMHKKSWFENICICRTKNIHSCCGRTEGELLYYYASTSTASALIGPELEILGSDWSRGGEPGL